MGICASQFLSAARATTSTPWSLVPALTKVYEIDENAVLVERPPVTIYKARHRTSSESVAIKCIVKRQQSEKASALGGDDCYLWQNELAIVKQCSAVRHPNVIEFKQVVETRTHVFVVMEFVAGGELFDALIADGAYSEWDARRLVKDALEAIAFLHDRNIIHRDITPENLLFTSSDSKTASIKVVNFALAKRVDDKQPRMSTRRRHEPTSKSKPAAAATHEQLTWPYCAPEILATIRDFASRVDSIRRTRTASANELSCNYMDDTSSSGDTTATFAAAIHNVATNFPLPPLASSVTPDALTPQPPDVTAKCDVWSIGIVLYVLLSGTHPFDVDGRQTRDQIVHNILRGKFAMSDTSSNWRTISREAKELLTLLLAADPHKRPSAAEALAHRWFSCRDTPRAPLAVSVSDGLGQYQRLMRKKFRTSVIVAMAADTFRRSLKKHQDAFASVLASELQDDDNDPSVDDAATSNDEDSAGRTSHMENCVHDAERTESNSSSKRQGEVERDTDELPVVGQTSVLGRLFGQLPSPSQQQQHDEHQYDASALDAVASLEDVELEARDASEPV